MFVGKGGENVFFFLLTQEVLKQLQGSIEEDSKDSQGQIDFLERLKGMNSK